MYDHPCGLVDDDDVRILVNNGKRNWIRLNFVDLRGRNLDRHHLARRHAELGLSMLTVDAHASGFDEPLDGAPAQVGKLVGDVSVEAGTETVARGIELYEVVAFVFPV
jgi:hypothetical protein